MDKKKILELANLCKRIVTIEEGTKIGGMGSGVLEILSENKMNNIPVSILGIPDRFIPHGSPALQREDCGLTSGDITQAARDLVDIDDHIRSVIS
jgi:1-deoxy-D-xylulose-5-phosphate synthase